MPRRGWLLAAFAGLILLTGAGFVLGGWYASGPLTRQTAFIVPDGASLASAAAKLEREGAITSARAFRLRARLLGGGAPIRAGEFLLPKGASPSQILTTIQGDEVLRRFVTVPEGMASILVHERLMAQPYLTGPVAVPAEGSVLPDSYDFERGESRQAVLLRMQAAMQASLKELWAKRAPDIAVKTPQEALSLAAIVEKETGKSSERGLVAGLYSNRLRQGIMLQADPTIIYPITRGQAARPPHPPVGDTGDQRLQHLCHGWTAEEADHKSGPRVDPCGAASSQDRSALYGGRRHRRSCLCRDAGRA